MKVAVVTPYYKEDEARLIRCMSSVRDQTYTNVVQYMIADGHARPDVIEKFSHVRGVGLPSSHSDFGNTPRAIGSLLALNEGADIVCFLDADNFFSVEHVETVVDAFLDAEGNGAPLDAVFSGRLIFFPGHEGISIPDPEDLSRLHVDTSGISLHRSAAFIWPSWGLVPKGMAAICDRVIFDLIKIHKLRFSWTGCATVNYESNWEPHYRLANLPVPECGLHDSTVKEVSVDEGEVFARLRIRRKS